MEALFVQTAASMTSDGRTIKLEDTRRRRCTLRPSKTRGRAHVYASIPGSVGSCENSFAQNPPNAVLSFASQETGFPKTPWVIEDPHRRTVLATASTSSTTVPATTRPCALFIHPFGRPFNQFRPPGCTARTPSDALTQPASPMVLVVLSRGAPGPVWRWAWPSSPGAFAHDTCQSATNSRFCSVDKHSLVVVCERRWWRLGEHVLPSMSLLRSRLRSSSKCEQRPGPRLPVDTLMADAGNDEIESVDFALTQEG